MCNVEGKAILLATDKRATFCQWTEWMLWLLLVLLLCYSVLIIMWTQSEYLENWIMPIHYYIYIGTKYIVCRYNCHTWLLILAMRRIYFFALFSFYLLHSVCLFRFSHIFCVCLVCCVLRFRSIFHKFSPYLPLIW